MAVKSIAPVALAAWLKDPAREQPLLLEVREPWEYQTVRLENLWTFYWHKEWDPNKVPWPRPDPK